MFFNHSVTWICLNIKALHLFIRASWFLTTVDQISDQTTHIVNYSFLTTSNRVSHSLNINTLSEFSVECNKNKYFLNYFKELFNNRKL